MKNFFRLEEAVSAPHKFLIMPNHDMFSKFFTQKNYGSYDVLLARLVNLPYAEYCRFCRDVLGAEIVGKNCKYMYVYFQKTEEVQMFLRLLNKRMDYLEHEFDHPCDYEKKDGKIIELPWRTD